MGRGNGPREDRGPYLPSGYRLDEISERPFVVLRAADGRAVARFSGTGASREEIEKKAWEDFGGRDTER